MQKKYIIVTGVSGFLGTALTKSLINQGYCVIGITRTLNRMKELKIKNLYLYENHKVSIDKIFLDFPIIYGVIHTATCYGRNGESIKEIVDANVSYPLQILESATKNNISFFINTDTVLQKYLNLYAMSKNQFLDWGQFFSKSSNIKFINIKLEHMYGPGDDATKFTAFLFEKLLQNTEKISLTPGDQERDFIYIDDVISAYNTILENVSVLKNFDELEVGTGKPIKLKDFILAAKKAFNSAAILDFGGLPYRKGEIMTSSCKSIKLRALGWVPKYGHKEGLKMTMLGYKK